MNDRAAMRVVKTMRFFADKIFAKRYRHRAVVLEIAAAVVDKQGCNALLPSIDYDLIRAHPKVLVGFSESPEDQTNTAHDVYVTMMYVGMLRRAPEQSGFDFWVAYMDAGNSGLALILGFLNAPEYHNRFLP